MKLQSFAFLPVAVLLVGCADAADDGDTGQDEGELAAPAVYVALGDSYSSGVGTREYIDQGCKRSVHAYPYQLATERGYDLKFVACGGAKVPDVKNNQLSALTAATSVVTISIGGNDAGFSNVITECAKPWPWTCWGKIDAAQSFIKNQLPGQLNSLYTDIRNRAPNAKVIVVGYPRIFNGETCNLLARISSGEQSELNETADLLATTTAAAAAAHGFTFVDARGPFSGHAICDDSEWINGLSDPVGESYHPNKSGHDTYTNLVSAKL